jgi:hypothetical protein
MRKTFKTLLFSMLALLLAAGVSPVSLVHAATGPVSPANVEHKLIPVTGNGKEQVVYDQVNKDGEKLKSAVGGEQYSVGKFERPFDENMNYLPYLDIVKSTLQREDPNFIYTTVQVAAPVSTSEGKPALYGLELDTNMDGRSEILILAEKPLSTEWSVMGVNVWKSTSSEKSLSTSGAAIPVTGAMGYDLNLFAAGVGTDADLAWVRLSPDKPDTVELAFKNTLVGGEKGKFVWHPVTDGKSYSSKLYDLNVNFSLEQAGSPLRDSLFYPLKEVFAVDNTCRVASGYQPSGRETGLCPLPAPAQGPETPGEPAPPNFQDVPA